MDKREFLMRLEKGLAGLPKADREERLNFYGEMIDDRVEDGLSEAEAVDGIGDADAIIAQIVADTPLTKLVKERMKPKKARRAWEIALLALGSPIWLSLLIAAGGVALSLYASLWAVIASLWAVEAALCACAVACLPAGVLYLCRGHILTGVAAVAAGLVCAGIAVFFFGGCLLASKGLLRLTGMLVRHIKKGFVGKEGA